MSRGPVRGLLLPSTTAESCHIMTAIRTVILCCLTDCVSLSLHLVVRFHCSAQGFATRDEPSIRPVTQRRQSTARLQALTGLHGVDPADPLGHWKDHAVGPWIALDHVLAR